MTRIALIAGTYQPERCGVAHYTDRLRSVLSERAIQSVVLTTHLAAANQDLTVIGVVHNWQITDLLPLAQAVHRSGAELLHIQHAAGTYGFERAIFLLPLLLRLSGWRAPIITTVHEYGWWEWQPSAVPSWLVEGLKQWGQQRGWWDREDGFLLTLSNALITTNTAAEAAIQTRLPHLKDRVWRIPIGANVEVAPVEQSARQRLRDASGWPDHTTVIAFFGFLHPVKGLETLLAAFEQVLAAHSQARLLMIGGVESLALRGEAASSYWDKLQTQVAELSLGKQVYLSGYLSAGIASQYLAGADLGVLPFNSGITLKSGSLLTLLAHGLPVVATRHSPPDPEVSEQCGVRLVSPRNRDGLAIALGQLLDNPLARRQLGAAGRAFAHQFSWSSIAQRHLEVYQTVLASCPSRADRQQASPHK